ncbi:9303_t:CDS:1, partial [Racocetra persica]
EEPNNPTPEEVEKQKQQLYEEYQQKFQKIASSVANLTTEILTILQKFGYIIQKIE